MLPITIEFYVKKKNVRVFCFKSKREGICLYVLWSRTIVLFVFFFILI